MSLKHRTNVLLDDERRDLLRARAAETGKSVGALIREAIDRSLGAEAAREDALARSRAAALESFLSAAPVQVGEPERVSAELEELYDRASGN